MKAEESKTKGTRAARSFGMVACWKGKESKGTEEQSLKPCQHAMLPSPSAGLSQRFSKLLGVSPNAPLLRACP